MIHTSRSSHCEHPGGSNQPPTRTATSEPVKCSHIASQHQPSAQLPAAAALDCLLQESPSRAASARKQAPHHLSRSGTEGEAERGQGRHSRFKQATQPLSDNPAPHAPPECGARLPHGTAETSSRCVHHGIQSTLHRSRHGSHEQHMKGHGGPWLSAGTGQSDAGNKSQQETRPQATHGRCARCGQEQAASAQQPCRFHPALLMSPGPLLFTPEWQVCRAQVHSMADPACMQGAAHYFPQLPNGQSGCSIQLGPLIEERRRDY